jgi:hypothetical protein
VPATTRTADLAAVICEAAGKTLPDRLLIQTGATACTLTHNVQNRRCGQPCCRTGSHIRVPEGALALGAGAAGVGRTLFTRRNTFPVLIFAASYHRSRRTLTPSGTGTVPRVICLALEIHSCPVLLSLRDVAHLERHNLVPAGTGRPEEHDHACPSGARRPGLPQSAGLLRCKSVSQPYADRPD